MSTTVISRFIKSKSAILGAVVISIFILVALFASVLVSNEFQGPNKQYTEISLKKPGFTTEMLVIPNKNSKNNAQIIPFKSIELSEQHLIVTTHLNRIKQINLSTLGSSSLEEINKKHVREQRFIFGTDKYGRSVWSRLLYGIRISILVGLLAVVISLFIGITLGAIAGYFGGWVDQIILFLINTTWSIPTLLLVFAIVLAMGRGVGIIFIAVGLTMWVEVARIVRGQVLEVKENNYVEAALSLGYNHKRILMKHILPNIIGPVLVLAAANFATAILLEAGLSYLGFGVKPPTPSIGTMLNENYGYALTGKPALALIPALTIMFLVLSFNLIGTGLRDAFDVKEQT